MGALVVLAAQAGTVAPGGQGDCVVLIRNVSDEPDSFDVLVHGSASIWATVDPALVTVGPGEEAHVWVRFAPPRDPSIPPGTAEYAITVSSHNDPSFVHAERGELMVGSYTILSVDVGAATGDRRTITVPLTLANAGNAAIRTSISVRDDEAFEPIQVVVPAGGSSDVELAVGRRRKTSATTVDVRSQDGEVVSVTAPYPEDRSALRRDLIRSGVGLLIVLVVAVVGGSALLNDSGGSSPDLAVSPAIAPTTTAARGGIASLGDDAGVPTTITSAAASGQASPAAASAPADLGKIVFVRTYGPDDRDIVVRGSGANGSEFRLRSPGSVESSPALSPDGSTVAYVREAGGQWRVCTMPAAGGDSTCYIDVAATSSVAWRLDGAAVYVARDDQLLVVPLDRPADLTPLAPIVPGGRFALSPDGTSVAVVDDGKIALRPLSGEDGVSLTVPGSPTDIAWSADGSRVFYASNGQIYSAPTGDGAVRQLTRDGTVNAEPTAIGRWVVFRSNRSGNGDLYAMRADSDGVETGLAIVTRTNERDSDPAG